MDVFYAAVSSTSFSNSSEIRDQVNDFRIISTVGTKSISGLVKKERRRTLSVGRFR